MNHLVGVSWRVSKFPSKFHVPSEFGEHPRSIRILLRILTMTLSFFSVAVSTDVIRVVSTDVIRVCPGTR